MPKEKVLSVRLRDDQLEKLKEISDEKNTTNSKFVRKLVNTHLKANENGKRVYHLKVQPAQYKTIEEMAQKTNMKPEKYLRRIIKSGLEITQAGGKLSQGGISEDKYKALEKEYNKVTKLNEELSTKYHNIELEKASLKRILDEQEETIEALSKLKNELMTHLSFLMNFFQDNRDILYQHDEIKDYMSKDIEMFRIIARQLGSGS